MPKNESVPKQSSATRSELTKTEGNEPVPALGKGGQPEADKPKHEEVESPAIREKREVAAAVRSGTPDNAIAPAPAVVHDAEPAEDLSPDDLAKQRFDEQVEYARLRGAPLPEEGTAIDLEKNPEAARIDGEPVEKAKKDKK